MHCRLPAAVDGAPQLLPLPRRRRSRPESWALETLRFPPLCRCTSHQPRCGCVPGWLAARGIHAPLTESNVCKQGQLDEILGDVEAVEPDGTNTASVRRLACCVLWRGRLTWPVFAGRWSVAAADWYLLVSPPLCEHVLAIPPAHTVLSVWCRYEGGARVICHLSQPDAACVHGLLRRHGYLSPEREGASRAASCNIRLLPEMTSPARLLCGQLRLAQRWHGLSPAIRRVGGVCGRQSAC